MNQKLFRFLALACAAICTLCASHKVYAAPVPILFGQNAETTFWRPTSIEGLPAISEDAVVEIVLWEGRNRQVRRMCQAVGFPVERLTRVRIGPLHDSRLEPGRWRDLTVREVEALKRAASGPAAAARS